MNKWCVLIGEECLDDVKRINDFAVRANFQDFYCLLVGLISPYNYMKMVKSQVEFIVS